MLRFSEDKINSSAISHSRPLQGKRNQRKMLKKQKKLEQQEGEKEEKKTKKAWKKSNVSFNFLSSDSSFPVNF